MKTILVVDDEETVARTTRRQLERGGYRVLVAHSPSEALEIVERQASEISGAVLDVRMPEMTGPELSRRLTELGLAVKVLFASGDTLDRLPDVDPKNFIQKPFAAGELVRRVEALIGS